MTESLLGQLQKGVSQSIDIMTTDTNPLIDDTHLAWNKPNITEPEPSARIRWGRRQTGPGQRPFDTTATCRIECQGSLQLCQHPFQMTNESREKQSNGMGGIAVN